MMSQPPASQTVEIETVSDLKSLAPQSPLLLIHRITSSDLELLSTQNKPFTLAWYGIPFNNTNNALCIRTLQSFPSRLFSDEPLHNESQRYADLRNKMSQQRAFDDVLKSVVTHVPQWFQCTVCSKWRIHLVLKQDFPVLESPCEWQCNNGDPPNECNMPQAKPNAEEYTNIQLNALRIQRELKQEKIHCSPSDTSGDWTHMAHCILDRMIRHFDGKHAIINPFIHFNNHPTYYKSIANPISIQSLKYELENGGIPSFSEFAVSLSNMLDSAMSYSCSDGIDSCAALVHSYCCKLVLELSVPSAIINMFKQELTHHNWSKNWDMPALEKEECVIDITESCDDTPSKSETVIPKFLQIAPASSAIDPSDTFANVHAFRVLVNKMKAIISQIAVLDEQQHFFRQVQLVGYRDIVANPIHFGEILNKIDGNEYDTMGDIMDDIHLLWSNCYAFNGKPDLSKPNECGFANYASELQSTLNEYIQQFIEILKLRGYIDDNNSNKIKRICDKLGLGKISAHRIYHFKSRLEIYECIERVFDKDVTQFTTWINTKTSNFCRDMKNSMNVKGPVIPLSELRRTISVRFKVLKKALHGTSLSPSVPLIKKRCCVLMASNHVNRMDSITLAKIRYFTDCDGNKVRLGLDCPFPGCDAALQCLYGVHNDCSAKTKIVRCNHCKFILSSKANIAYYHCIDGCLSSDHEYYLCFSCAATYCNSPQKYLSVSYGDVLAFYGVWICLSDNKCSIIIMLQDSNRISWQYKSENVYDSGNVFHGSIFDMSDSSSVVLDIDDGERAVWRYHSDVDVTLTFNTQNRRKVYHKLSAICKDCKCLMQFLYKETAPNYIKSDNIKCCDEFSKYDYMKYKTLKAMNYIIYHNRIYENDFYFYCTNCNDYSICAGCALIKHETEMNKTKGTTLELERDYWRNKYEALSKSMHNVLRSVNRE